MDFELFDIIGPSDAPPEAMGGSCLADTFVVTQTPALNSDVPVICGLNTGQHGKMWLIRIFSIFPQFIKINYLGKDNLNLSFFSVHWHR